MDTAIHYVGIREHGANKGPQVSPIIIKAGGTPGQSWCMWFVRYCVQRVCDFFKRKNPMPVNGSCSGQLRFAKSLFSGMQVIEYDGLISDPNLIKPGDILIFKHGEIKQGDIGRYWNGHTGFTKKNLGKGLIESIEGNTNKAGSREGDGVYDKIRNIYKSDMPVVAVIRF